MYKLPGMKTVFRDTALPFGAGPKFCICFTGASEFRVGRGHCLQICGMRSFMLLQAQPGTMMVSHKT